MDDLDVREQLAAYAGEAVDVDEFEMWITDASVEDLDDTTAELVFDSLRLVSEFRNGDWSESELRGEIGGLGRNYWLRRALDDNARPDALAESMDFTQTVTGSALAGASRTEH